MVSTHNMIESLLPRIEVQDNLLTKALHSGAYLYNLFILHNWKYQKFPFPQTLTTSIIFSPYICLSVSDDSREYNHIVFLFLSLTYFIYSIMNSRCIQIHANCWISYPYNAENYSVVFIYHISLIHSSINRHIGCFYIWLLSVMLQCMKNAEGHLCRV